MDPEVLAAIPLDFSTYVRQHPEVLPDYRPFAGDMIGLLRSHPDRLPVLIGPHGIGKSRLLTPAILEAGERAGLSALGSVGSSMISSV